MDKLVVQLVERFCNDSRFIAYGGIGAEMVCQVAPRLEQVFYTAMQQAGAERFGEVGVGTYLVAFLFVAQRVFGCQQYNGYVAGAHVFFQLTAHLVSVHYRHHNVTDDDVRYFFQGAFLAQLSVGGSLYFKVVGEGFGYIVADVRIVFHYQQYGFVAG